MWVQHQSVFWEVLKGFPSYATEKGIGAGKVCPGSQNPRRDRTCGGLKSNLLLKARLTPNYIRLAVVLSDQVLKTSRDGDPTTLWATLRRNVQSKLLNLQLVVVVPCVVSHNQ